VQTSCGLLSYAQTPAGVAVLLVHPGGPYWRGKDQGAWSIPKGLAAPDEDLLAAAQREFGEETGFIASPPFMALSPLKQRSGKTVHCWAFKGDHDLASFRSTTFEMQWPPKSGQLVAFPEIDRAEYFSIKNARQRIVAGQRPFLDELAAHLSR
jgi:predicted NUDIX family NTP pyrophosphohydrolase